MLLLFDLSYQRKFRRETSELRTVEKWCPRASEVKERVKSKSW